METTIQKFIHATFLLILLAWGASLAQGQGTTTVGFYSTSCPQAESTVTSTVQNHFSSNARIGPALLRLHFHDCFVEGCDASVLLNDTADNERTSVFNGGLGGFDVIDDAKRQLELECPGIVSCADILALATRDAIVLMNGPSWLVPTGRRDGRVSLATNADEGLPRFTESIEEQKAKFSVFNLTTLDLVTLVGGHTIGTTACQLFSYRLFTFNDTHPVDPSIDPSFVPTLQDLCPQNANTGRVDLDTGSAETFDNSFFTNLRNGRGILESDQKLWTDAETRPFVQGFLGEAGVEALDFNVEFVNSMVKMGNIGVKTSPDNSEIRQNCFARNPVADM